MEEERAIVQESLKLNIYDLTCMNELMRWFGLGVYHSAIEAYGAEYAYGAHDFPSSGVFEVKPRLCPGFKFRKSLTLGTVRMGAQKFRDFVEEIACEYTGDSYHVLSKNCNHFCNDVSVRLVRVQIPGWINRLANIGSLCNCLLPAAFHDDGIQPYEFEAYEEEAKRIQDMYEQLANPLAVVAPKRNHLVSLSALLYYSKHKTFLGSWKSHHVFKDLVKGEIEGNLIKKMQRQSEKKKAKMLRRITADQI